MSFLRIPPLAGVGGERLYTPLRPTACGAGEGHEVARGDTLRRRVDSSWHPAISIMPALRASAALDGPLPPLRGPPPPASRGRQGLWRDAVPLHRSALQREGLLMGSLEANVG